MQLRWSRFRAELPVTIVLAFAGVAISAAVVTAGMHFLLGWSVLGAAFFGVLIAATDPVSVIAAFKEMKAEPRLSMVVESESLLNDGGAAVGFAILVGIANGGTLTAAGTSLALLWTVVAGVAIGAVIGIAVLTVAERTTDHRVEVTLTTVVARGSFLPAELVHASGVFAALAAGLIIGNVGPRGSISIAGGQHVLDFWAYAAFLANSCQFLLIGSPEAHQPIALVSLPLVSAIVLTLIGRAAAVYPLALPFARSGLRLPATYQCFGYGVACAVRSGWRLPWRCLSASSNGARSL
jgi:CPA1 family monovalent cation:H+ antiporter